MDFELQEDHREVSNLAKTIFTDFATLDRVVEIESMQDGFDAKLWSVLAESGLLDIAVPESAGGAGLGLLGLVALLEEQGRRLAAVPLWSVIAGAALPIAEFGTPLQRQRWLPGILNGSALVTGAFDAPPGQGAVLHGRLEGDRLTVSGRLPLVPAMQISAALVAPVQLADGTLRVALIDTKTPGLTVTPVSVTSHESAAAVDFAEVVVGADDLIPDDGTAVVDWTRRRIRVALAALQAGVCAEALRMTAEYTSQRMQFGRPLSTNQAVAVRAADAYIDTEAIALTTRKAAWLLDQGNESAAESASLVAKWWADTGGLRVVLTGQHLHGGIGADVDFPIHRYFLWGRQIAFAHGSADGVAAELGAALETAPRFGALS